MASDKEKEARSEQTRSNHKEKDSRSEHDKTHSSRSEKDSGKSVKQEEKKQSKSSSNEHDARNEHESHNEHEAHAETHSRGKSNRETKSSSKENRLPAGKSARTTDHEIIRRWVEERGGSPATVKATESGEDPGLLRINFPGYSGANRLEDISWEDFFKKFDEKHLEFLYQDETRNGETSRFWKFVAPTGEPASKGGSKKGEKK